MAPSRHGARIYTTQRDITRAIAGVMFAASLLQAATTIRVSGWAKNLGEVRRSPRHGLRRVDPRTMHFGPMGLGGALAPAACLRLLKEETEIMVLPREVPRRVRRGFKRLLRQYQGGLYR